MIRAWTRVRCWWFGHDILVKLNADPREWRCLRCGTREIDPRIIEHAKAWQRLLGYGDR